LRLEINENSMVADYFSLKDNIVKCATVPEVP